MPCPQVDGVDVLVKLKSVKMIAQIADLDIVRKRSKFSIENTPFDFKKQHQIPPERAGKTTPRKNKDLKTMDGTRTAEGLVGLAFIDYFPGFNGYAGDFTGLESPVSSIIEEDSYASRNWSSGGEGNAPWGDGLGGTNPSEFEFGVLATQASIGLEPLQPSDISCVSGGAGPPVFLPGLVPRSLPSTAYSAGFGAYVSGGIGQEYAIGPTNENPLPSPPPSEGLRSLLSPVLREGSPPRKAKRRQRSKRVLVSMREKRKVERPEVCILCSARFPYNRDLERHWGIHYRECGVRDDSVACTYCLRTFTHRHNMLRHAMDKHRTLPRPPLPQNEEPHQQFEF